MEWWSAIRFQFTEDFGKKSGFGVQAQHVIWKSIYNREAAVPETTSVGIDKKRFQGIRNLITHVWIRQVQTCKNDGLQFLFRLDVLSYYCSNDQVDKHDVWRVNETNILKLMKSNKFGTRGTYFFLNEFLPANLVTIGCGRPSEATLLHLLLENLSVDDTCGIGKRQNSGEVRTSMLGQLSFLLY